MRSFFRRTRVRLTFAVGTAFFVIAAAAASIFGITFAHVQYGAIDASLSAYAHSLSAGLQDANGTVTLQGGDQSGETDQGIAVGVLLLDARGRVLEKAGIAPPPASVAALAQQAIATRTAVADTVAWTGHVDRASAVPVQVTSGSIAIVTSRPVQELQQTLFVLAALLMGIVLVLTAAVVALAHLLAGRALRPVRLIATAARDISEHDLHRRVELCLPQDELGELASTFNEMLGRLEVAFGTLQQFTADAAHELRAPLALMKTELEVSLRRARTPQEYEASQQVALAEVEHLSNLVNQLLILARADAGALQLTRQSLHPAELVEETADRWRQAAAKAGVAVRTAADCANGELHADAGFIRRLLDNLVDNAIRHTPPGGLVTLSACRVATAWEISVSDTGLGVPESMRKSLFERFTRGDPARTRGGGGAGLGLALCRVIAELHGGSISLQDGTAGATFVVRLPLTRGAYSDLADQRGR